MGDPAILFVKPKAVSQRDKKMLRDAGVLIVEIDDQASAKFIRATTEVSSSAMLLTAMRAIKAANSQTTQIAFTKMMTDLLEDQANNGSPPR